MTPRRARIEHLRSIRAFHHKLGRRKRVIQIDAELVPLVNEELAQENLVETVRRDFEWLGAKIGASEMKEFAAIADGDLDAADQVYEEV